MKQIIFVLLFISSFYACNSNKTAENNDATASDSAKKEMHYGIAMQFDEATPVADMAAKVKTERQFNGNVTGVITAVCKHAGCWADLDCGNGQTIKILFRNADSTEFSIDKNAIGRTLTAHGIGFLDTTSVEKLKHYAEDDEKSKEEIAKITEPEIVVGFRADAAMLKAKD
jgi:hypothetical protein